MEEDCKGNHARDVLDGGVSTELRLATCGEGGALRCREVGRSTCDKCRRICRRREVLEGGSWDPKVTRAVQRPKPQDESTKSSTAAAFPLGFHPEIRSKAESEQGATVPVLEGGRDPIVVVRRRASPTGDGGGGHGGEFGVGEERILRGRRFRAGGQRATGEGKNGSCSSSRRVTP
jgi:hypothetical protein